MKWQIEITETPEFDEKYPSDPADWEAELISADGNLIAITIPGTIDEDGDTVRPVPRERVEKWLQAMGDALVRMEGEDQ